MVTIPLKDGTYEEREIYTVSSMPTINIKCNIERKFNGKEWKVRNHAAVPMSFDIETSEYDGGVSMYIWQFAIGTDTVVLGRTWKEFEELCLLLNKHPFDSHIYVHNLTYEMNFMIRFLQRSFGEVETFMKSTRQVLTIRCGRLIFHDSLAISGMSLDRTTKDYNKRYVKASGDIDHTIRRNCSTRLSNKELSYCIIDVLSLNEYIQTLLESTNYKLYELPITRTSFVRKAVLRDCREDKKTRKNFKSERLTARQYIMLKKAFQGGLTCGNAYKEGIVIKGDIRCRDITSSYPYQTLARYFPRTEFREFGKVNKRNMKDFFDLIENYCVIFKAVFINIRLKDRSVSGKPFISYSKCEMKESSKDALYNGKVISADILTRYMCEVEFNDILSHYDFDELIVSDVIYAMRGELPSPIREKTKQFFRQKTVLKGVSGKELEYLIGKGDLNSIFGMFATAIDREVCTLNLETLECSVDRPKTIDAVQKVLDEYYDKKSSFVHYQWACYVTAWARHQVIEMMDICGANWLYTDTDSVYYISTPDIEAKFEEYNKTLPKAYGDYTVKGKWSEMGEVTPDGAYTEFVQYGAKKYVKRSASGELILTVAGVPKVGVKSLKDDIYNFRPGICFRGSDTGKLRPEYHADSIHIDYVNGVMQETASYIKLLPCDYLLSDVNSNEYWLDYLNSLEFDGLDITQGFN